MTDQPFSEEQKQYLAGFAVGSGLTQQLPTFAATLGLAPDQLPGGGRAPHATDGLPVGPERICYEAQDRHLAAGRKLCPEESAKRKRFPLDQWDDVRAHAADDKPPKGADVLAFKYQGLFWVAPAQDAFMCRLRFAGGIVASHQLRGVARLADELGGGYADVTTRANLQVRQIKPADTAVFLEGLHDLGILNRGAGADNVRNITASPTAGIDPQELIDTRPLARELHHYILNHREMYGLPRKFNIAFDGGGKVSSLEDTNDIGFTAVRTNAHGAAAGSGPGVYFHLTLGGITGHQDFARGTGVLLKPEQCLPVAVAVIKAFIEHGDRTDRKRARLKYVLDRMGFDAFLAKVEKHLPDALRPLPRFPMDPCEPRPPVDKHGHVGVHAQKQPGLCYVGVVLPVGRMTSDQMRGLATIADAYGSGTIRLTVWQNLLISDVPDDRAAAVRLELRKLGLDCSAGGVRGGLVACTGNAGCKYAATDTKAHALRIADHVESRLRDAGLRLDPPVNIHLTGCPHSCAQHYIGDVGLLGTKVPVGDGEAADVVEGYHVFIGGGYGATQGIGREIYRDVPAADAPAVVERMLRGFLTHRRDEAEPFDQFVRRHTVEALRAVFEARTVGV